jgi:hypothetical protein
MNYRHNGLNLFAAYKFSDAMNAAQITLFVQHFRFYKHKEL